MTAGARESWMRRVSKPGIFFLLPLLPYYTPVLRAQTTGSLFSGGGIFISMANAHEKAQMTVYAQVMVCTVFWALQLLSNLLLLSIPLYI